MHWSAGPFALRRCTLARRPARKALARWAMRLVACVVGGGAPDAATAEAGHGAFACCAAIEVAGGSIAAVRPPKVGKVGRARQYDARKNLGQAPDQCIGSIGPSPR